MPTDRTKPNPTGLLWYDDNPKKPWTAKLEEAIDAHQKKFFIRPNVCFINPKTAGQPLTLDTTLFTQFNGVDVYLHEATVKNHFFVFYQPRVMEPAAMPLEPTTPAQMVLL